MGRVITKEELDNATPLQQMSPTRLLPDGNTVVKTGRGIRKVEADVMKFVRKNTTIPVPEIYNVYTDQDTGFACILMEYVKGQQLDKVWPALSENEKESVVQQFRGYFDQLRQFEGSFIGSFDGSQCEDQLFPDVVDGWGPYKDESEFNDGLVNAWMRNYSDDPFVRLVCKMHANVMQGHKIVLTHNDFAARNILLQGSQVVAILDWELAGYYPEYWEYCKALWRPEWDSDWIKDGFVDRSLKPYLQEAAVLLHTSYRIWS